MLLEELKKLKKKYNVESKTNKKDIVNTLIEVRGTAMNIADIKKLIPLLEPNNKIIANKLIRHAEKMQI